MASKYYLQPLNTLREWPRGLERSAKCQAYFLNLDPSVAEAVDVLATVPFRGSTVPTLRQAGLCEATAQHFLVISLCHQRQEFNFKQYFIAKTAWPCLDKLLNSSNSRPNGVSLLSPRYLG